MDRRVPPSTLLRCCNPVLFRRDLLFGGAMALTMSAEATAGAVTTFDHVVVFGDSLSDNGNAGRFSNGPVWVEVLANRLGLALRPSQAGGRNYAVGGARLDPHSGEHSLRAQADQFLRASPPAGRTLYVVYGGGNDVLGAVGHPERLELSGGRRRSARRHPHRPCRGGSDRSSGAEPT